MEENPEIFLDSFRCWFMLPDVAFGDDNVDRGFLDLNLGSISFPGRIG
jgi:hypothetical protein